uniref:Rhs family protein n=1 Tax=Rheinheimera sp. BAL341 TaxID=1708203 RepID=A0A486XUH9_9GAMM
MQLAQIIGDTTPTLPYVPAPSDAGCGTVGTIIMVAVAVALTVVTAGAAAAAMGGVVGSTGFMSAGAAVLGGAAAGGSAIAGVAAAAIGGFVGSVGSQLVGKAMGVVDSFSLKNALVSGITAGATAGVGSAMSVGTTATSGTFINGAKAATENTAATLATLNGLGKVTMAASNVGFNIAANKLVGNQASFSWRNVATSAVSAGAMHGLSLNDQYSAFERFSQSGDMVAGSLSGTLSGIAGAAIGYGAGKLIQQSGDRPSWNFTSVATDAFGNALGNSFVANRVNAEQTRLNAMRASEAVSQQASKAVNAALDAQLANTSNTAMANVATQSQEQTERIMQALAYNRALDLNEVEAAQNAKRTDQTLARIEAVNAQSAALQTHANEMQQHYNASMKYRQESTDFALKEALARGGNAAFTSQKRQDLMAGVDVEGYIAAAIQRRGAAYSSVGLGAGAANGSFGDFATWYGASLANESWQALQFMGKAVVNGLTLGTMNDRFSPLSSGYHSLIGDNTLFGNPTTFAGAVGLKSGVYGSYGLDPLAAVGALGKLSKFDLSLNFNKRYSTQGDIMFVNQTNYLSQLNSGVSVNGTFVRTVTPEMGERFKDMGYLDPRSNTIVPLKAGEKIHVDHIFPTKEIIELPGFKNLTKPQMESILQDTIGFGNLQPLPSSLNQSKGAKLNWSTYKGEQIDSIYEQNLINNQREISRAIQRQINSFNKLNNGGN